MATDNAPTAAKPKSHWFCITPDKLLVAMLALEVVLFLSERFRWFAFNEHKGWTVLIAVASVGMGILLMSLWYAVSLIFRRRFQFSIRSLTLLVVVVSIPCSWLAAERQRAERQRQAVEAIESLGGDVQSDYGLDLPKIWAQVAEPPEPEWLRHLLGDDFFRNVTEANLSGGEVTDAGLVNIKSLNQLIKLELGRTEITDVGLVNLKGLAGLQTLSLVGTKITDAGMVNLEALTQLQELHLMSTEITGAGLVSLSRLTGLRVLSLGGTSVTDAGLVYLTALNQLNALNLYATKITGSGLIQLKGLIQLQKLGLGYNKINDSGLVNLTALTRLQTLGLDGTQITDNGLIHLGGLTRLQFLVLTETNVTDAGVMKLQQALPNCQIKH